MDAKPIVRDYIARHVLPRHDRPEVSDDYPLLDAGLIDSMGIFELVGHLEEACGVRIEDDELIPENFNSIERIAAFVDGKRSGSPSP